MTDLIKGRVCYSFRMSCRNYVPWQREDQCFKKQRALGGMFLSRGRRCKGGVKVGMTSVEADCGSARTYEGNRTRDGLKGASCCCRLRNRQLAMSMSCMVHLRSARCAPTSGFIMSDWGRSGSLADSPL